MHTRRSPEHPEEANFVTRFDVAAFLASPEPALSDREPSTPVLTVLGRLPKRKATDGLLRDVRRMIEQARQQFATAVNVGLTSVSRPSTGTSASGSTRKRSGETAPATARRLSPRCRDDRRPRTAAVSRSRASVT